MPHIQQGCFIIVHIVREVGKLPYMFFTVYVEEDSNVPCSRVLPLSLCIFCIMFSVESPRFFFSIIVK